MKRNARHLWFASAAIAVFAVPGFGHAQTAPPAPPAPSATPVDPADAPAEAPAEDDGRIGDIVVTAQRRAEALQRVPVAATVLTGDQFAKGGNFAVEDLEKLSPSLTFDTTTSARNNSVRIRGIGTNTPSSGIEPATSTVVDGVVLLRPGPSSSAQLLDLDRIEVLRGPQGTLFGKNAVAGVLNIATKNPTDRIEGDASISGTDDEEFIGRAALSIPLSEGLGVRLAGAFRHFAGNVLNVNDGSLLNSANSFALHGKLRASLDPTFDVTLGLDYGKQHSSCCARPIRDLDLAGSTAAGVERPLLLPVVPGIRNTQVNNDTRSQDDSSSFIGSLTLEKRFGEYALTSITAYQSFQIEQRLDDDLTSNAPVAGGQGFKQVLEAAETDHAYTQEIRLASPKWDRFDFVVGLYALAADTNFGILTTQRRTAVPTTRVSDFLSRVEFTNLSAFGQGNLHITDALTVLFGARYTYDRVVKTYSRRDDPISPFRNGNLDFGVEQSERNFSFKAGGQYQFTPDLFAYVTYAQGYKGPGFNVSTNEFANTPFVEAETADSYEAGAKVRLFDRRVGINLAVFKANYDNFAISAIDVSTNTTQLINAATLNTQGFELDLDVRPLRGLILSGGVAYVDATFDVGQIPCYSLQTAAQGCRRIGTTTTTAQAISNGEVPNSPNWKFNVNADYAITLESLPFDINLGVGYSYTGPAQYLLNQDPEGRLPSYGLLEMMAGFSSKDDKYRLDVFVKNLTDQFYVNALADVQGLAGSKLQFIPRDVGRYFGARLSAKF